jgi:hypothetical protein
MLTPMKVSDIIESMNNTDEWVIGRINQKPVNTGKKYYNNGTENKLCIEHPGEGWQLGMIQRSNEWRKNMSESKKGSTPYNKGKSAQKLICRISDRKEMDLLNFNRWGHK